MSSSFFTGLNRYTLPYCIFSKIPASTSVISSRVVCLGLKPICSAKQIAGRYGFFLQALYAFLAPASVNLFSCAIILSVENMFTTYINLMNRASKIKKRVLRFRKHASRSIKYICYAVFITYMQNTTRPKNESWRQ